MTGTGEPDTGDRELDTGETGGLPPAAPGIGVRLPLTKPVITYVVLGVIVAIFVADMIIGAVAGMPILSYLGAQINSWVGAGEYWRLFSSIFLHASLTHLAFNGWALYSIGRDIEAFYGHRWFAAIYFLAGLAGSLAWYVLGRDGASVGASGAIFGLIGAEVAFFLRNRALFGKFGSQRLSNLAVLIGINLLFGFTVPNINNHAHLGGLTAGFVLGFLLAPRYVVQWSYEGLAAAPLLVDTQSRTARVVVLVGAVVVLAVLVVLGNARWGAA